MTHRQFLHPRYKKLFVQAWAKAGYYDDPDITTSGALTPCQYCFDVLHDDCEIEGCEEVAFLRCSYCEAIVCFEHFYINEHDCPE